MTDAARQVLHLARTRRVIRARDLAPLNIPRRALAELAGQGKLLRRGRGMYTTPGPKGSEHQSLAEAAARVPSGIVCLLSALRFHGLTTQNPWEVWIAIKPKDRKPKADHPPLRVVRFSGKALTEGVQAHRVDGVDVRVYSPAKTVADCFRYRNKIGVDVAVEALRDAWQRKEVTADQLWHFAGVCRVTTVMRPYLESVVT